MNKSYVDLPHDTLCACGQDTVALKKSPNKRRAGQMVVQSDKCRVCLNLSQKYGIDRTQRDAQLAAQNGCCELCNSEITFGVHEAGKRRDNTAVVDHCHASGAYRGILCGTCNLTLGNVKDSPDLLRRMATYLERRNGQIPNS